jgi:hypothetical protein
MVYKIQFPISSVIVSALALAAAEPTGLRPPTAEEQAWMDANLIQVERVQPNTLAKQRFDREVARKKTATHPASAATVEAVAADDDDDITGTTADGRRRLVPKRSPPAPKAAPALTVNATAVTPPTEPSYPTAVDNSAEDWFPPVGDQDSLGSCAAFSTTYYTMTSQVARLRGWKVKNAGTADKFSPRFVYNQINGGADNGSWIGGAYAVMQTMGVPTWQSWPYNTDCTSWPLTADIWREAINYRMAESGSVSLVDADGALALDNAKQLLANGYILNFATNYLDWEVTTTSPSMSTLGVLSDNPETTLDDALFAPDAPSTRTAVLKCALASGIDSGHALTIVGYNDNVWTDLNDNGVVDPGETGAFRIVNSWGAGWTDGGYLWVAYDALLSKSAVTGVTNPTDRVSAFWGPTVYWIRARAAYTPTLLAEITATYARRNQMALQLGRAVTPASNPTSIWKPAALQRSGGPLAFDGSTTAVEATFVLDATDLQANGNGPWVIASVLKSTVVNPAPATITSVRFIDGGNANTVHDCTVTNPSGGLPMAPNGQLLSAYTTLAGIVTEADIVAVREGGTATLRVCLSQPPTQSVNVTLTRDSGDPDLSVNGEPLVFTPSNWNTWQTLTLAAAPDADTTTGKALFTCRAPGWLSAAFTAQEVEPPLIRTSPASRSCPWGTAVTLTVTASGAGPLSYQWYQGASGNTAAPIPGTNNARYTTPLLTASAQFWVRVSSPSGSTDSATAFVSVALADWAANYGLSGTAAAPAADPNHDGVPNLLEYAFGTSPVAANPADSRPRCTLGVVDGQPAMVLTHRRNKAAKLTSTYQQSTDLVSWSNRLVTPVVVNSDVDGNGQVELVTVTVPLDAQPKIFLRIAVSE